MIELKPDQFARCAPLIENAPHNLPVMASMVEGNQPGRIFVDALPQPRTALLCTRFAYAYVVGDLDGAFAAELPDLLFDQFVTPMGWEELILFTFSDAWRQKLQELLMERGVTTIPRNIFHFNAGTFAARPDWRNQVPEGIRIVRVDAALAPRIGVTEFWQSVERFVERGVAYAAMDGDTIASYCIAAMVGGGEAEIDIQTSEAYRGRGLATRVASAMIEECLQRDLTPAWSCWPERGASRSVAAKLGFEPLPDVPAVVWLKNRPS